MRFVTYEWIVDRDDSGIEGLWPVGVPRTEGFYPTVGLGLAHDLLEHQNGFKGMGSYEDELEALGAILFVRGYYAMNSRHENTANNCIFQGVAVEIEHLYERRDWLDMRIYRVSKRGEDEVDLTLSLISETIEDGEYLRLAKLYMMRGYNKAFQRFGGNQWAINDNFFDLVDEVDVQSRHAEEGQKFRLAWSLDRFMFYPLEEHFDEY